MGIEYDDDSSVRGLWGEESSGVNERVVQSTFGLVVGAGNVVGVGLVGCANLCCDWGK